MTGRGRAARADPRYVRALTHLNADAAARHDGSSASALVEYVESILAENGAGRFAHLSDAELYAEMRGHDWSRFDGRYDRLWDDGTEPLGRTP